jgi:iron complex outermembrane receptor protein
VNARRERIGVGGLALFLCASTIGLGPVCVAAAYGAVRHAASGETAAGDTAKVYVVADTVLVLSERLPADPRRAPAAVTVISGEDLRPTRGVGIEEALSMVPGILALSRSGGTDVRITARGFGARGAGERSNAGTTRGIRILLDGSPLTEPDGRTSLDLADPTALERVTVLRSNGSVLFGSASGGVIDLGTPSNFRGPFTELQAAGGAFGLRRWAVSQGLAGGPTRVYLSGSGSSFDGWRAHSENERTILRGSLFCEPSTRTSIALYAAGAHNLSCIPGALTSAQVANRDSAEAANPDFVQRNERRDNRIVRVSTSVRHRYAPSRLIEIAGFVEPKTLHRSERKSYRDFQRIHDGGSALHAWSFAPFPRVGLRWSAGIDGAWQDGTTIFYNLGPGGTRGTSIKADKREAIRTLGVFSEVEGRFGSRWTLTAGLRHDDIRYAYDNHAPIEVDPSLSARKTLREVTPRGAVAFLFHSGHTTWAAVTSGLEAPAFNETDPPPSLGIPPGLNPILKPARSLTFEGGLKGRIFGTRGSDTSFDRRAGESEGAAEADHLDTPPHGVIRTWTYDLAAYRLEVRNDIIPWDGGAYYFMDGTSRRQGVEIGTELSPGSGLRLRVSGALSSNWHVTYRTGLDNFDNMWSAGIPGRSLNAILRWEPRAGFYLEAAARHCGPYYADDANTARVPAWTILDGAMGARVKIGGMQADVALSARNLADRLYTESVWVNAIVPANPADARFFEPGLPRNFVASITLRRE